MPLPSTVSKGAADTVSIVLDVEPIYPDFYYPDFKGSYFLTESDYVNGRRIVYNIGPVDYNPEGQLYYGIGFDDNISQIDQRIFDFNRNGRNILEWELTPTDVNYTCNGVSQGSTSQNLNIDLSKFASSGDDSYLLGSKFIGNFYSLKIVKNGVTELEIYPHLDGYFYDVVSKSIVTYEGSGITFNEL